MGRADRDLGHKLGPRLVDLMVQATLATRAGLAPVEARTRQAATQAVIDRAGLEVADLYRPLVHGAIDAHGGNLHPDLEAFLRSASSGRHQWQALAGLAAGGTSGALSSMLSNALAPVVYAANRLSPQLALDPQTAAAAAAAGIVGMGDAQHSAAGQGYDSSTFQTLYDLAQNVPALGELQDLVNRGLMPEADAVAWLRRQGYAETVRARLLELREQLLAPADAALAELRGNMSHAAAEAAARRAGVPAADFAILVGNTGEPLALESLLEARRRGFIDQATLDKGIRQSRVRNEWIATANKLTFSPMSTADAIDAVVQGHLSEAAARDKAHQNGLEPGDFAPMLATAGEPLSRTEMEQLFNRGLVSKAEVEQAVKESRLKPKYTGLAFDLHVRLPEPRQVISALNHGTISKAAAARVLGEYGFSQETVAMLVATGAAGRTAGTHALTLAEVRQLYSEQIFTAAHAEELLHGMGYDAADSALLIRSWDLLAGAAITRQAVGAIRSRYVAHVVDDQAANMDLAALGIPAAGITRYLHVWAIERSANVRRPTEAQVVGFHKKALISGADALARLTAMGYTDDDAHLLLGVQPGTDPDAGA
jgi:hypothetical protein